MTTPPHADLLVARDKNDRKSPESDAFKAFMKEAFPPEARKNALMLGGALGAGLLLNAGVIALVQATSDQETFECFVDIYARGNSIYSENGVDPCADINVVETPDGTLYTTEPEAIQ